MLPLICLDVDGTLVGSAGVPTDETWAAADRARSRGQHLTLCTARLAAGPTREWAERLDPTGWHIFHTGGARWNPSMGEVRIEPLAADVIAECLDIAEQRGWVVEAYSWDDYTVDSDHPLAVGHAGLLDLPFRRRPLTALEEPIVRMQFVIPVAETTDAIAAAPNGADASSATSPALPGAAFVSITAPGVSKAHGIEGVAGDLGIDMADVMMVGDGHNDLSAVMAVGWGVAMGNAEPELRLAARLVVADVDAGGAVEAIDRSAELVRLAQ